MNQGSFKYKWFNGPSEESSSGREAFQKLAPCDSLSVAIGRLGSELNSAEYQKTNLNVEVRLKQLKSAELMSTLPRWCQDSTRS